MELHEIVMKLIGPISPAGETNADEIRFKNLQVMTGLIDDLLYQVRLVAEQKDRHEFSIKRSGKHADDFLIVLATSLRRGL